VKAAHLCLMFVLLAVRLPAQSVKADHYLDIPGQGRSGIPGGSFFPGRNSLSSTSHPPPSPLKITFVSVDVTDLEYGDYFNFEVLIENISKEPVVLPWSPDAGAFAQPVPRTPAGFLSALVLLQVESESDPQSMLALFDAQALYGSSEVPRSLLTLAPGRAALLRVPAQVSATTDFGRSNILQQPGGVVRLRAGFAFLLDNVRSVRSASTLPIRVRPRELR